ncbi:MAG: hypothetical protein IPO55_00025 [Alphaproteobacteria bacterium]|nr:hypothetical protein [Alphaproteobacteria bacterium]
MQEDEKGRLYIPGESVTPPPITDADASTGRYHLIKNFLGNMEVKQQGTSRVIEISFRSFDPQLATQIANTHTKQYVFSREQDKKRIAEKLDKWLTDEIRDLKEEKPQEIPRRPAIPLRQRHDSGQELAGIDLRADFPTSPENWPRLTTASSIFRPATKWFRAAAPTALPTSWNPASCRT